jgi:uncharacterized membrane protein
MQNPPPMSVETGSGGDIKAKTALGLDANLGAALGYPVGILAIVIFIMEKGNRFARFHALQSILYHVGAFVLFIVLGIVIGILVAVLSMISSSLASIVGILLWLAIMIAVLVYLAGLLFCGYKAYTGASMKLPIIGNMAEKIINK